ncbi:MAG: GumC family protein [Xanthobacteraceae bacterium]|nr:GumC family protein [Xanthobacteraceae bacterium]
MTMMVQAPPPPAAVVDFRSFIQVLARRKAVIAAIAGACLLAALAAALLMSPRFVSDIKILVDPRGLQILPNDLNPNAASTDVTFAILDSQVQLITSTEVLRRVIDKLHLTDDPEFGPDAAATADAPPSGMEAKYWATLRALRKRIDVRRPDRTFVLTVSVWTRTSAEKSKRIADAIGDAYLAVQIKNHADVADRTAAALESRLVTLQQNLNKAEKELDAYRVRNNLVGGNGRLLSERELNDLTSQLSAQRMRTFELKTRVDALRRRAGAGEPVDVIPEALQSQAINDLRARYAEAKKAEADSQVALGPRHPAVIAAKAQVVQIRQLINDELARIRRGLIAEYQRAQTVEAALNQQIIAARELSASGEPAIVKLRALESEVAAQRAVLETMQRRAKEVREEGGLDRSNARIISPAAEQPVQYVVPRTLIVAGGLLIGLLAGIFVAAFLNQADNAIWSASDLAEQTRLFNMATLSRKAVMAAGNGQAPREALDAAGMEGLLDILKAAALRAPGAVLVVSADQPAASGGFTLALAGQSLRNGCRVLTADATRGKYITRACKLEGRPGLTDDGVEALKTHNVEVNGLQVVPVGTRAIGADGNAPLPAQARALPADSDITLIDGGSLDNNDFMWPLALAGVVLIVVGAGQSHADKIKNALHVLNPKHQRLVATIFLT